MAEFKLIVNVILYYLIQKKWAHIKLKVVSAEERAVKRELDTQLDVESPVFFFTYPIFFAPGILA